MVYGDEIGEAAGDWEDENDDPTAVLLPYWATPELPPDAVRTGRAGGCDDAPLLRKTWPTVRLRAGGRG